MGDSAQAVRRDFPQLLLVVRDAAAGAAQGEGGTDDDRVADLHGKGHGVLHSRSTTLEGMQGWPIFSMVSLKICRSSALSMVSGLAPSSRTPCSSRKPSLASCMDRVRPVWPPRVDSMLSGFSFSMMRLTRGQGQGLDVDLVRHGLVGHDGGGVGVDQHDLDALLPQGPAGLGAGVVEFRGLADHNGAGADDQYLLNVLIQWHISAPPSSWQKTGRTGAWVSRGPAAGFGVELHGKRGHVQIVGCLRRCCR